MKVAILGAGVTGLTAGWTLRQRGVDVAVFEEKGAAGGACQTMHRDGWLCEIGPNTLMLSNSEQEQFLEETGLMASAIEAAPHAKRRFIVREGKPVALPSGPASLFTSSFLSWKGKLRLLAEPWQPPYPGDDPSIAQFFAHRLGQEAADELIDPFVSGVYAGDPSRLRVRHVMPSVWGAERRAGSIVRGMLAKQGPKKPRVKRRLLSWPHGLGGWMEELAGKLGDSLRRESPVLGITFQDGLFGIASTHGTEKFHKLLMTVPAKRAAELLSPLDRRAAVLEQVPLAPLAVLHLGFARSQVGHPLDGFGMLISRRRGLRTLGVLFSSTLFPGRAPEGHVLLTAFIGGRCDPAALSLSDAALVETALSDLRPLLKIEGIPVLQHISRWDGAIPQYEENFSIFTDAVSDLQQAMPGLRFASSFQGGVSLGDRILRGREEALAICFESLT